MIDATQLIAPILGIGIGVSVIVAGLGVLKGLGIGQSTNRKTKTNQKDWTKGSIAAVALCAVIVLAGLIHLIGWFAYGAIEVDADFKREVHGHTVNAYWANTPELMIHELKLAKAGLQGYDLSGSEYSTLIPWDQTPDNRMDYQYALIDSVIQRAEAVKADRDRQTQQGTSDQLGDVYETKMDNLRDFIGPNSDGVSSDWLDETGRGAYEIKQHPYYAWWNHWGGFTIPLWLTAVITGIVITYRRED